MITSSTYYNTLTCSIPAKINKSVVEMEDLSAGSANDLGVRLYEGERPEEANNVFKRVLILSPNHI